MILSPDRRDGALALTDVRAHAQQVMRHPKRAASMSDTPDPPRRRKENLACLEGVFAALGRQDLAASQQFCHPDFAMELPYADPPTRVEGFGNYAAYVAVAFETFTFELSIEEVHDCIDPDLLIVEYTSEGRAAPTGNAYQNRYIGLWRFAAGRIQSGREYYNPDAARKALGDEPDDAPR